MDAQQAIIHNLGAALHGRSRRTVQQRLRKAFLSGLIGVGTGQKANRTPNSSAPPQHRQTAPE